MTKVKDAKAKLRSLLEELENMDENDIFCIDVSDRHGIYHWPNLNDISLSRHNQSGVVWLDID